MRPPPKPDGPATRCVLPLPTAATLRPQHRRHRRPPIRRALPLPGRGAKATRPVRAIPGVEGVHIRSQLAVGGHRGRAAGGGRARCDGGRVAPAACGGAGCGDGQAGGACLDIASARQWAPCSPPAGGGPVQRHRAPSCAATPFRSDAAGTVAGDINGAGGGDKGPSAGQWRPRGPLRQVRWRRQSADRAPPTGRGYCDVVCCDGCGGSGMRRRQSDWRGSGGGWLKGGGGRSHCLTSESWATLWSGRVAATARCPSPRHRPRAAAHRGAACGRALGAGIISR